MNQLHEIEYFFTGFKPVRISIGRFEFPESFCALVSDKDDDTKGKTILHVNIVDGAGKSHVKNIVLESNVK